MIEFLTGLIIGTLYGGGHITYHWIKYMKKKGDY